MSLTIDGAAIKTPTKFLIRRYNLTKSGRVASGKMTMEIIAQKREFNFEYSTIMGTELDNILNLIMNPSKPFFTLAYMENGVSKSARCYAGAIPSDLLRSDIWMWTDVNFSLIEQ
ncbi:hypothetical protein [Paenibacillus sp. Pae108]|uniref:hypothetical protein n=1 Tax=Paenibacillus sp. Pae108 TaxID=2926019 RepID=UPI002118D3FA|nr:hypothetical protein [Paenibacillus sp. Pae108]